VLLSVSGMMDSIVVVNEVVEGLKRSKKRGIIVKVDFEKSLCDAILACITMSLLFCIFGVRNLVGLGG